MIDQTDPKTIVIPEGKMEAPGDYELKQTSIRIGDSNIEIPTIEQVNSSNCVEYSLLQGVLLAKAFEIETSEEIDIYLQNKQLDNAINHFERSYVLHVLEYFQQHPTDMKSTNSLKNNFKEKVNNIYAPLNGDSAISLFKSMFKGVGGSEPTEVLEMNSNTQALLNSEKPIVLLESDTEKGHATVTLVIGNNVFNINTSRRGQVILLETPDQLKSRYGNFLNGNNYLMVYQLEYDK